MDRGHEERRGVLVGWALGAYEAGLIVSGSGHLGSPWIPVLLPLTTMVLYGCGGWALAQAVRWTQRSWPWNSLALVGALGLTLLAWRRGLPDFSQPLAPIVGLMVGALLFALSKRSTLPKMVAPLGALSILVGPVAWCCLVLFQPKPHLAEGPTQSLEDGAPNVVLVTWDTIRADSLPLYGGGGLDTPELDRLASEGIVMDDFQAVAPITGPAHATLLTGMWPPSHGLRANGHRAPTLTTPRLPEILRDRGWHTGGFVSALPVFAKFGFDRGFEHFDDRGESTPLDQILQVIRFGSSVARLVLPDLRGTFSVPGQITVDRALDWMGEVDGPTFTWLHLFDAHGPFLPPEPYRARALARAGEGAAAFDPQDQDDWIMQRGEIELLDDLLGQVRRGLEERDPGLKNTLLVVVSDHGECFGEGGIHGEHEPSLYAATQRIPAVLKFPDALAGRVPFAQGRRSALSSQVDVAPTLLAALGIAVPPTYQGVDMFAVEVSARSGVYMEAFQERLGEERLHGWVSGEWKYTRSLGGVETLWRRGKELENLATKHPDVLARMREALDKFLAETPIREAGAVDLSDADMQAMEALGYADSADD